MAEGQLHSCVVAGILLAGLLLPVAGGFGAVVVQAGDAVDTSSASLAEGKVPLATTITDSRGAPIAYVYEQYRIPVEPDEIAETMKAAIVAIEDRRFFSHAGIDWQATGRAMLNNLVVNGSLFEGQGGSTITMQYVKNYRLYAVADTDAERTAVVADTLARKIREARVAVRLEQRLSKQQILARYLNIVYFGNGAYGVSAAARTYFDSTPVALTISQAALLAGLVRSPSAFDPVEHPQAARDRRNVVIDAMVEVGSLTRAQAATAKAAPLGVQPPLTGLPDGCAAAADPATGFFCQYTLDYLQEAGLSAGELRIGGYTIRTTLDRRAGEVANEAAEEHAPVDQTTGIANAVAIVAPGTEQHRVVALAANRDFGFDAESGQTAYPIPSTPAPHGAGSIYKIFTAAAAMARGLGIQHTIPVPDTFTTSEFPNGGQPYTVSNAGEYPPSMTLQRALAVSPNTAFVALEARIGSVDPVVDMAYRLGMRDSLRVRDAQGRTIAEAVKAEERGSFTLGPVPTSPLDLANVAATLMSGGVWCPPTPIESITDRHGEPVALDEAQCEQAVPTGLANTLAVGLSKDHTIGTAAAAADAAGWQRPMLGKTGTTQRHVSAGFVGATPQYAGAVMTWSDASPPRPICVTDPPQLCSEGTLFGATIPAQTWFDTMAPLHDGLPVAPLPPADPVYVTGPLWSMVPE
ncbi:MAG: penicillin-binding protein [Pseudonocardiaceae bacterium]|nr:penicillin-binding protein [Pseudonocardiaceae bacterium]